jgi:hypothetical protein
MNCHRVLGQGRCKEFCKEEYTGPEAADVRAGAQAFGLGQFSQRCVELTIVSGCPGANEMKVAPSLDGGQERKVGAAPAAHRTRGVLGPADGTT